MSPGNFGSIIKKGLFLLIFSLTAILPGQESGRLSLNETILQKEMLGFELTGSWKWKFHLGDNPAWKDPGIDDGSWKTHYFSQDIKEVIGPDWKGAGWFRCRFFIDETLMGRTAAIYISHLGKSEIYLNGKMIHKIEQKGGSSRIRQTAHNKEWKAFIFDKDPVQVIAVRYINNSVSYLENMGFNTGIHLRINTLDKTLSDTINLNQFLTRHKISLTLIPLILAILHLLLYLFYPALKENLFYSLCLFSFAAYFYSIMQRYLVFEKSSIILYSRLSPILNTFTIFFLLLTCYSIIFPGIPKRYRYYMVFSFLIGIWGIFKPIGFINVGLFFFSVIVIFECLKIFLQNWPKEKKGIWIILIGILTLALMSVFQAFNVIIPMIIQNIKETPRSYYRVYTYGGTVFIICMSVYLSYQFSRINEKLKLQLAQVKKLAEENLYKEKKARQIEIERRILESDNKRKTGELEEARKLQLSMLPTRLDQLPELNACFHMTPALEVGGDYYDYQFDKDRTLVIAVGDATGHGLKAGIMVAAAKSLFQSIGTNKNISDFFNSCTDTIKQMHMGNLYMALTMVRIKDRKLTVSSAGMPPILIYRGSDKKVEEIKIKGPPLGGISGFKYPLEETKLFPGDKILLMSDGFPELFNENDDMLGYSEAGEIFRQVSGGTPDEIVALLRSAAEKWRGNRAQEDDITFVVLEVRP